MAGNRKKANPAGTLKSRPAGGTGPGELPARWRLAALAVILVVTAITYLPILKNGLLAWDDVSYITNNQLIRTMDLKAIFSSYVLSNYHPFTILSLTFEYQLFGLNPAGYHAVSLLLHLLNTLLVWVLAGRLVRNPAAPLVAGLLFGIHPMHVESVAWASEQKDLLYTLFFLASCIVYLDYCRSGKAVQYIAALALFIVSLLSKAMAASLPVILVLVDVYLKRGLTRRVVAEKIPFVIAALAFGIVAVLAQQGSRAMEGLHDYSFLQRIAFASTGYVMYLVKMTIPYSQTAFYSYPAPSAGVAWYYWLCIPVVALFLAFSAGSYRFSRDAFFATLFFTITVFLVLQLLPVGKTMMAERYLYLPSVGLCFLAGVGMAALSGGRHRWLALVLLVSFSAFYSVSAWARTRTWKDDLTLWNDVARLEPSSPVPYFMRGSAYMKRQQIPEAMADFSRALSIDPGYYEALYNRSIVFSSMGKESEALKDLDRAVGVDPSNTLACYNRGTLLLNAGRNEEAARDFTRALADNPEDASLYNNRGIAYLRLGKLNEAENDLSKVVALQPGQPGAWIARAGIRARQNRDEEALSDYDRAVSLDPQNADAFFFRGNLQFILKRYKEAGESYTAAINLKTGRPEAFYNRALIESKLGRREEACADMKTAASMGFAKAAARISEFCR